MYRLHSRVDVLETKQLLAAGNLEEKELKFNPDTLWSTFGHLNILDLIEEKPELFTVIESSLEELGFGQDDDNKASPAKMRQLANFLTRRNHTQLSQNNL